MIDSGADKNSLDMSCAKDLMLEGEKVPFAINGVGGIVTSYDEGLLTEIIVRNQLDPNFAKIIKVQCFPKPAGNIWPMKMKYHLKDVEIAEFVNEPIRLIIGNDNPSLQISLEDKEGIGNQPSARKYRLGWCIFGPVSCKEKKLNKMLTHVNDNYFVDVEEANWNEDTVKEGLIKMWDIERYETDNKDFEPKLTPNEVRADQIWAETAKLVEGHKQHGLLWKKGEPKLENNFDVTLRRLFSLENYLKAKPNVKKEYEKMMNDTIEAKYWERVNLSFEKARMETDVNYIAHFPVLREDKTTTKVRVVFDAKAKFRGKAINDGLLQGRKNMCDVVTVLANFRLKKITVAGDVKLMFLQVMLRPEDRKYVRMIWRPKNDQQPQIYESTRHTFGLRSSPFVCIEVTKDAARKHIDKYPIAAKAMLESTIVDDVLTSVEDEKTALELIEHLKEIYDTVGMKIRKFASNSKLIMDTLDDDQKAPNVELTDKSLFETSLPVIKVLGLIYLAEKDIFTFRFECKDQEKYTKAQMLSVIASLYDPLSFLAPFTIRSRILFQKIWSYEVDWKDEIPIPLRADWMNWIRQTKDLDNFQIKRCLDMPEIKCKAKSKQIHVFVDASAVAYACALYMRVEYENSVYTNLIFCKAKVVPVKQKPSIPRAELEAAKIGVKWGNIFASWYEIETENVYYWGDSKIVLWWLHRENFPDIYVENRAFYILQKSKCSQWRYVNTSLNPADLPTKGISVKKLSQSALWKEGPNFLKQDVSTWESFTKDTREVILEESQKENENVIMLTCQHQEVMPIFQRPRNKFASFQKMTRIAGYVFRFIKNIKEKKKLVKIVKIKYGKYSWNTSIQITIPALTSEELRKAKERLLIEDQEETLLQLKKALIQPKKYTFDSNILRLSPAIDGKGIIRMFGRLQTTKFLSEEVRCPIILGKDSSLAKGIVYDLHIQNLHSNSYQALYNDLKRKYSVMQGLSLCKRMMKKCNYCKKKNALTSPRRMGLLPESRVPNPNSRLTPFANVGIDHMGIIHVNNGEKDEKRYLLVFVCMMTRAVHIEVTVDKSTKSTVLAFTRFQARFGTPKLVNTDNAGNFLEMSKQLEELKRELVENEIEWIFNPPKAAWFGGHFEIFISLIKKAIFKSIPDINICLNDEELLTLMAEIQRIINTRPLQYVSADGNESILTPAHFMIGSEITSDILLPKSVSKDPKKRYTHLLKYLTNVWKKLSYEYLPSLNMRQKWHKEGNQFGIGDVVLIKDINSKKGHWPIAIIQNLEKGKDGISRIATLRSKGKEIRRGINSLVPIIKSFDISQN
ncbi:Gypsy retrotransposon integrase 1 [Paramuricea clavata]|uniref:Gypsy retrotransposon integrase 1 n=1 Tax=Paramuricea clavata TaxID=317549 RepID=A0A6S7J562_PARCT|nr:Gypsy retrotransposon integrase 1 [Paramuricea clavata]